MKSKKASKSRENSTHLPTVGIIVAIISFLGVALTAYFNYLSTRTQIELPIQFTQTANADNSKVTPSTTIAITDTPHINVNTPQIVFGPADGEIQHAEGRALPNDEPKLWLRNFMAEATLSNPYDVSQNCWDYGFGFRSTGSNQAYRLSVRSDDSWKLYLAGEGKNGIHDKTIFQGQLSNLDTSSNGSNTIRLIVQNETADFYLNGVFIKSLDLSGKDEPGGIYIGTGFYSSCMIFGESTRYQGFTVWELP